MSSRSIFLQAFLLGLHSVLFIPPALSQSSDSTSVSARHRMAFALHRADSTFSLGHEFIVDRSDTVWLDSTQLKRGADYLLDLRTGVLTVRRSNLPGSPIDSSSKHSLIVSFESLPFVFQRQYQHREAVIRVDSTTKEEVKVAKTSRPFSVDDIFGSSFQKSGSIVRGLTVGSNRDLSLNSGFRMQMAGTLAQNLEIVASLTDENTPIQPEGTTQTLQEIDKVFIEVKGTDVGATLGDFNLDLEGNEFARLDRKLQGAKGIANFTTGLGSGDVILSAATTRGKFTTFQFQGLDGVQGPYRLFGKNGERDIIIIAGTERVYVDGEQMTRGELNDYTIDYANAEISFASRRLISAASRITVDFEYNDRQFNRNLMAVRTDNKLLNDRLSLSATFLRESDDKTSPLDVTLNDTDKAILASAGANRSAASKSGVDSVGPGKGQYERRDTSAYSPDSGKTIPISIYVFSPQDTLNAVFTVAFTFVGAGNGDYNQITVGHYQFAGIRQGSYAPLTFLPMPEEYSVADFDAGYRIADDLSVKGEFALSKYDANQFSEVGGTTRDGAAGNFGLTYSPKNIHVGNASIGSVDLSLHERHIDKEFVALDRVKSIEFNRDWNIQDSSSADENLSDASLTYLPTPALTFASAIGQLRRGPDFTSNKYDISSRLGGERLPSLDYNFDLVRSDDERMNNTGSWTKQQGTADYAFGNIVPGLRFANEDRRSRDEGPDTLEAGSYRFNEIAPRLALNNIGLLSLTSQLGWRYDDSLAARIVQRASTIFSQQYGMRLAEWNSISSSLDVTLQDRSFTDVFKRRGDVDARSFLARSETRYSPFNRAIESDWFYEVGSERTAKLQRIFQSVPIGTGNYVYIGDVNHNNIVDEPDFQLARFDGNYVAVTVPSDQFIPVTDVKASARIRLNGSRFFTNPASASGLLSVFSSETYSRVDEKNTDTDTKELYFLHLSRFLNDSTTLQGSNQFSQDLYAFENSSLFSLRLRYLQLKGLTQFALQNERTYSCERSVRVRWSLVKEFANQTDVFRKTDALSSTAGSYRVHGVVTNGVTTDWSYKPEQKVEFGFTLGVSQADNFDTTTASLNTQAVRLLYSFETKGQARIDFSREEVLLNRPEASIPFELTGGRPAGKTWIWKMTFDYRLTQYIQSSVSYDGRNEGSGETVHTGKAEVRAFF